MPLHPSAWWLAHLRDVAASYGARSATLKLWKEYARADGYTSSAKLSGGSKKHRARPARDALFLASRRSNKDVAEWWQDTIQRFAKIAANDAAFLSIHATPKRADLAAAYREWVHVIADSIAGIYIGNYKEPRLERARRTSDGRWTGKYWILIPKTHQAATDDAALRALQIDLARAELTPLPDAWMTARAVAKIRARKARRTD